MSFNTNKINNNASNNQAKNNSDSILNDKQIRFNEFKNKLPIYNPPIKIHCGLDNTESLDNYMGFSDFIPDEMNVAYGYVNTKETYDLIIFGAIGDDIYPYIYSYDCNGNILDSFFLIISPCGGADEYSIPNSYAFIKNVGEITLIDSTSSIKYTNNTYEIVSTMITTVSIKVDDNGKFREIKKEIKEVKSLN
mgnify:CR=1 FL=1